VPYGLSRVSVAEEWLARTEEAERRDALLVWMKAVSLDPPMATSHRIARMVGGKQRGFFNVAVIEAARCVVTFSVSEMPVRAITLLRIYDL
jgi:hypothetical protein